MSVLPDKQMALKKNSLTKKILFLRDENFVLSRRNKNRLLYRGKSAAVSCPQIGGIGWTVVGGYVGKLYLCMFGNV